MFHSDFLGCHLPTFPSTTDDAALSCEDVGELVQEEFEELIQSADVCVFRQTALPAGDAAAYIDADASAGAAQDAAGASQ